MLRSDNGPQMRSNEFYGHLKKLEVRLSHEFIPIQTPNKNAHIESFFSILERELLRVVYFISFEQVYQRFHEFVEHYNGVRIHGSLGYRTPMEVIELMKSNEGFSLREVRC